MNKGYLYIGSLFILLILLTGFYKVRDYRTQKKGTIVTVTLVKIPGGPGRRGNWVDFQYGDRVYSTKMRWKELQLYQEGMRLPMKHLPGTGDFVPMGYDARGELVVGGVILLLGLWLIYTGLKGRD